MAILAMNITGGTPMDRGRLPVPQCRGAPRGRPEVGHADGEGRHEALPLRRDRVAQGVGGRLAAPWFRIHPAERRVGQALPLHLRIAFTRSNRAWGCVARG